MKKRKSFLPRRRKSSGRYGLEAAVLCVLLIFAAYVSNTDRPEEAVRQAAQSLVAVQKNAPPEKQVTDAAKIAIKSLRAASAGKSAPVADDREYRLVRAADGDSFELRDEKNRTVRVRLYGIDAPESSQRFGKQSREHLIKLIKGRPLRLKTMYLDNYKRAVSIVYLINGNDIDELSVNQRQVQAGMAWVYDYFCTSDICRTWKVEEAMARKEKLGLWKDTDPTPPWQWRRTHKH